MQVRSKCILVAKFDMPSLYCLFVVWRINKSLLFASESLSCQMNAFFSAHPPLKHQCYFYAVCSALPSYNHACRRGVARQRIQYRRCGSQRPRLSKNIKSPKSQQTCHLAGYRSKSDLAKPGILSQMQIPPREKSFQAPNASLNTRYKRCNTKKGNSEE